MKLSDAMVLLKLANEALSKEPPNLELARGALQEVVGSPVDRAPEATELRACTIKEAARRLGYTPKFVRSRIASGELADAVIGAGRSTRIIVERAIEILGAKTTTPPKDEVEAAGESWAKRRAQIRAV